MTRLAALVRPGERREFAAALGTAFLVMVAHALLETARDTLFLTNIPPRRLPWLYLTIAVLAVIGGPLLNRPASEAANRRTLVLMQVAAAVGTAAFLIPWQSRRSMFYALYIWGGMAAAVILTRFWLILGDRLTASQAKRLFPLLASGAVLGSLVGFGSASLLAVRFNPHALLAASAVAFLGSALAALVWWRVRAPLEAQARRPAAAAGDRERRWPSLSLAVRHPYVRRLALVLLLASIAVTVCDFVFKSAVSHAMRGPHLASFLARAYFSFDLAALLMLLVAVSPLMRGLGAPTALAVRPALLAVGGVLLAAGGGLPVALALRGVDGSLRWSLHKTASELLYVPLAPRLRAAVKELSDLVAQRGGQALGSLIILLSLATPVPGRWLGAALIAGALLWIRQAWSLRAPYVDLFRETLNDASAEIRLDFPELDVASLESLLAAFNSPDDARVCAALDLFAATGRVHVIPVLILYHPAPAVVVRALELFAGARRSDFVVFGPRLIRHADAAVRATAMRAWAAVQPDAEQLRQAANSPCPIVSATAVIAAAAHGAIAPAAALEEVRRRLPADGGQPDDPRPFVARALRDAPLPAFSALLGELAAAPEGPTRREAVLAMGALRDAAHLPLLIGLLAERALRDPVRRALLAYGDEALTRLERGLADASLPYALRVHIPRAISRFGHQRAADALLRHLRVEPGGMVRYKILRGLGRVVADLPGLHLDRPTLEAIVDDHLAKAFPNLHWSVVLSGGAAELPARQTVGHRLLLDLIAQRQCFAVERLFRVLGLSTPGEDFAQLYDGVHSDDAATRAAGRELLEQVLPARWRAGVLALTDDAPAADRLAAGRAYYAAEQIDYDRLVVELIDHRSDAVSALASYHALELGLIGDDAAAPLMTGAANWLAGWRRAAADLPRQALSSRGAAWTAAAVAATAGRR